MPFFANIPAQRLSKCGVHARRFVNVTAEKVRRLLALQKLTHGPAAGVTQIRDAVERGAMRRHMADGDHGREAVEGMEAFGQFLL